jgi:hypothetical protein
MLRKFAAVLIAASMLTAPAFAQGTATPASKAPATATAPAAKAPAASTVTTKVIKKNKKAKHVKHVRHVKHVKHVKKVRHHPMSKTVVAKPLTAPAAIPSRTN